MKINHLFFIVSILLITSCTNEGKDIKETKLQKVKVLKITSKTDKKLFNYSASIEADNTVYLGFLVAGRVENIYVQEGQFVKKGQLLASIEQISYQNAFNIANASLELANDNFNRLNQLHSKGSLPESDFIAAKVSVTQANANKNLAEKNFKDTKLYTPFSGMITSKLTEVGATAAPGVSAFTIMKTDKVYAKASISESEISKLKIGAEALVEIPSMNKSFKGKVAIINYSADPLTRTFNLKIRIDNPNNELLPGMISTIKINSDLEEKTITIPAKVIVRDNNNITYVFVLQNNKAIKKRVWIKGFNKNNVIVSKGIVEGDQLIVKGYTNIKDGQSVSL